MKPRRSGYSLVECLVVMVLTTASLGMLSWTVHTLFRAERQVRDALAEDRGLDRFIAQLRADAHQASAARAKSLGSSGGLPMELTLVQADSQRVQYMLRPRSAERIVWHGDTMVQGETYALPGSPAGWDLGDENASTRISLRLDRRTADTNATQTAPALTSIEVAVGLFASSHQPAEEPHDDET